MCGSVECRRMFFQSASSAANRSSLFSSHSFCTSDFTSSTLEGSRALDGIGIRPGNPRFSHEISTNPAKGLRPRPRSRSRETLQPLPLGQHDPRRVQGSRRYDLIHGRHGSADDDRWDSIGESAYLIHENEHDKHANFLLPQAVTAALGTRSKIVEPGKRWCLSLTFSVQNAQGGSGAERLPRMWCITANPAIPF